MKGTLQDQIKEAVKSGKLKAVNIGNRPSKPKSISTDPIKRKVHFKDKNLSFMKELVAAVRNESLSTVIFPSDFGSVDIFLDRIYYAREEEDISDFENFFCLAGLAKLKLKECGKSAHFKQRLTIAIKNIQLKKQSNKNINKIDWEDFEEISKFVQSFINDYELGGFKKRKAQEEYKKKQKEITLRCSEIENLFTVDDIVGAKRLIRKYQDIISHRTYKALRKYSMDNLSHIVAPYLDKFDFVTADRLFEVNHDVIWPIHYKKAKDEALSRESKNKITEILEQRDYSTADEIANSNPFISNDQYISLKSEFVAKDVKAITKSDWGCGDAQSFAACLVRERPESANNISFEKIARFALDKLPHLKFSPGIYGFSIEQTAKDIQKGLPRTNTQKVFLAVRLFLKAPETTHTDQQYIWTIFLAYPSVLQDFLKTDRDLLDKIAGTYPFDRIDEIYNIYPPSEEACLQYLKNINFQPDGRLLGRLKEVSQVRRYFNCKMVVALLEAKKNEKNIRLKDILRNLLQEVVNQVFNYNLKTQDPIKNLIFPRCISNFEEKNFKISHKDYVFCEGKLHKNQRILCRNRLCKEKTDEIGGNKFDNDFFDLLKEHFNILSNEFFSDQDFVRAMGSFNRWNEIADRLVCGYGEKDGCGSPLACNYISQVESGWAAYAVTLWHCSNTSCEKQSEIVKLSHCGGGCGKIIDSRIDTISCKRSDGKDFYICLGCGYCCPQHQVSGICPKCGKEAGWDTKDPYFKWYRCRKCGHEIAVPWNHRDCLGTENTGKAFKASDVHRTENKRYSR